MFSDLRLYLAGQSASVFGSSLTATATSVVAVTNLHATPREISFIVVSATIPALLFGPICGVLADRILRPRRVLVLIDLICGAVVLACAAAAFTGLLSVAVLCGVGFLIGLSQIFVFALYFTHLRSLDNVEDLGAARGRLQSSEMVSRAIAGTIAGPLLVAVGAPLLFLVDALSYAFSASCLRALRSPDRRTTEPKPRTGILREMRAGVSVVLGNPLLTAFAVYAVVLNVATNGTLAQRALYLLDTLHLPVALYSAPMVVATLLGALGSLLAPKVLKRGIPPRRLMLACSLSSVVATTALPLAGGPLWSVLTLVTIGIALPGLFGAASNLALITILSDDIGDEYFGRMTTLMSSLVTLASAVGALLGGVLAERLGIREGIWVCQGIAFVAVTILLIAVRRGRTRAEPPAEVLS
ncbi:MFS transporter [Nonomuraea sediminis]|uniref:MFS transporter n=1 Tax=Nonomuraea sediminis TaxID=2835864 RepID=UPI001BDBBFA4|nr:MFS transporter [Nonomuraea sediminis]